MAIPKINLIPPAYYLRKQARLAAVLSIIGVLAVVAALVAFALVASARNAELKQLQAEWQARADAVSNTNQMAASETSKVADLTKKTEFITKAFDSNAQWATVFENIRDYTYPRVTYTTITPTAGSNIVTAHIKVPDTRAIPAQEALNLYWANLTRSPSIVAAAPAVAAGQPYDMTSLSGGPGLQNPEALRQYLQSLVPPPPPTYEFDMTIQLKNPIQVATYSAAGGGADAGLDPAAAAAQAAAEAEAAAAAAAAGQAAPAAEPGAEEAPVP